MKTVDSKLKFTIFMVIYETLIYLSNDSYLPGLPSICSNFNISAEFAQYTLVAWWLGGGSIQLLIGPLSDRFSRQFVLLSSGLIFSLSSYMCASALNIYALIFGRFLQGASGVAVTVICYSAVHQLYRGKKAVKILSIMASVTLLAPALGPMLGACIIKLLSWRYIFSFTAIFSMFILAALIIATPNINYDKVPINVKNLFRDYKNIITNKVFLKFMIPYSLILIVFFAWLVKGPFIIINTHEKSELFFGIAQLIACVGYVIGAKTLEYIMDKLEIAKIINFGTLLILGSSIILLIASYYNTHIFILIGMVTVGFFGSAFMFTPLNRLAIEACKEPMGRRIAVFSTISNLAGSLGTMIITITTKDTFFGLAINIIACMVISSIVYFSIKSEIKLEDEEEEMMHHIV